MRNKKVAKQKAELGKAVRNNVGVKYRERVISLDGKREGSLEGLKPR